MRVIIEKLVHGGMGLGLIDGKRVFVPFSAPGDVLECEISEDHDAWTVASIISIIESSPCRVRPRCPIFGECGGCQWQHISYDEQLRWKREILAETLSRIGGVKDAEILPALASPKQWHYRNRIQLHVDSKGRIGFYRPKSKHVAEVVVCAIADERINDELNLRREEISKRDRGIALKVEGGESFAQVNTLQNEQLKATIVSWLRNLPHENVLELHCGSGNFTFAIASVAGRVLASDIDGRAIRAANNAREQLRISNVDFLCASAVRAAKSTRGKCDVVILDPPRKGCAEVIDAVAGLSPRAILYVSCDPATLARDAKDLGGKGYLLAKSLPIDMFPQTYHIESFSLFLST